MAFLETIAKIAPALTAVGGIASGVAGILGAREQRRAADRATGVTQAQLGQIRADTEPFRLAGITALERLLAENIGPLEETPDFRFVRDQGQQAIDRSLAARGKRLSGQGVREGIEFASGLAGQQAANRRATLAGIAGVGPGATNTLAAAGLSGAGALSNLALQRGAARASSFAAPVNAFSSTIEDLISQAALRGLFNRKVV